MNTLFASIRDIPRSRLPIRHDIFSLDTPVNDGRGRGKHRRAASSINPRGMGEEIWDDRCVLTPGSAGGRSRVAVAAGQRETLKISETGAVSRRGVSRSRRMSGALHAAGHTRLPYIGMAIPLNLANLDRSPMLESPENEPSFVIHASPYKYIVPFPAVFI